MCALNQSSTKSDGSLLFPWRTEGIFDKQSSLKDVCGAVAAGQTDRDRQMKQTQGPQRFAFCANQINTFNKAYRYQTAIQICEKKISQFTHVFNVQMLQKIVCNPGNKNTIKTGKLSFLHRSQQQKRQMMVVSRNSLKKKKLCQGSQTHFCVTRHQATRSCKIWSVTLIKGVVRGAEARLLQQQ